MTLQNPTLKKLFALFLVLAGTFATVPVRAAGLGSNTVNPVDPSKVVVTDGYSAKHPAIDLAPMHRGEPLTVSAAADGDVIFASACTRGSWCGSYGYVVVVKHANEIRTLYGHLSRIDVKVGDHVTAGQAIGKMGETGYVIKPWNYTGSVLHFAVCTTYCSRATNLKTTLNPLQLFPAYVTTHATQPQPQPEPEG